MNVLFLLITVFLLITDTDKPVNIFLAGDSTMSIKLDEKRPETGWGEKLNFFFDENVKIKNFAKNGRSTKTFLEEGIWDSLLTHVNENDYIFIQFGHNDQSKHKPKRFTPIDQFKMNLAKFVEETKIKKAIPVLLTPVVRRRFDENGDFYDVHGKYPDAVRNTAKELDIDLLDMHEASKEFVTKLGEKESKNMFLILEKNISVNYPEGIVDNTHFSEYGAKIIAELSAKLIAHSDLKLKNFLKSEYKE